MSHDCGTAKARTKRSFGDWLEGFLLVWKNVAWGLGPVDWDSAPESFYRKQKSPQGSQTHSGVEVSLFLPLSKSIGNFNLDFEQKNPWEIVAISIFCHSLKYVFQVCWWVDAAAKRKPWTQGFRLSTEAQKTYYILFPRKSPIGELVGTVQHPFQAYAREEEARTWAWKSLINLRMAALLEGGMKRGNWVRKPGMPTVSPPLLSEQRIFA